MAAAQVSTPNYMKGVVKQVLSGDAVIVRGLKPKGGPPPERQINFSNVIAPKLARRATSSQPETQDEPYAWEAREFLRKKLVGREILFTVETKTPTGREYGTVFLGKDTSELQNITELMISEGYLSVRRESLRGESNLTALEDAARSTGKGKWSPDSAKHVRDVKWSVDNLRTFIDKNSGKPIKAIIEHIRDGSTVRAFLLPDFYHITLMISGIRCPMFKVDSDGRPDKLNAEPFAEEARFFVESRLLQRDVEIILETFNNNNLVGSILHPNGNIADLLLREGFGKCIDWSMATVTGGPEKLRSAERLAKSKKLRLWTDYKPAENQLNEKEREFVGKVCEIVNGDALIIKKSNGKTKKVFLSSIRPPRPQDTENQVQQRQSGKNFRPLYDIPWLYEAREFLRKKLIGQKVHATVDYVQPPQNNFPEKFCCTVKIGDINVAEAMVSKGLATVLRYRQDDDQRASCYDDLLSAEAKASKDLKGLHSKKDIPIHRVTDISGDPAKAKSFLPFLQRAGRTDAVVEFVASGSRMRLYIPKETCLITFLLAGISCPKATRPAPGGAGTIPGEPYGAEALDFTKEHILQREVQIEVDSMDKGGNFIGWLHFENQNLSVMLVEHGLSSVHSTAEGSKFSQQLTNAEQNAKKKKLNIWANYVEEEKEEKIEETLSERKIDYRSMMISEVTRDGRLFGQYCSEGPALESMMENLRRELAARPPVAGAYTPKKGELCAAKFVDGLWYRAKVEKLSGGQVSIFYIDYGNREITDSVKLSALPGQFISQPAYAHEFRLALVKLHTDEENIDDAITGLTGEVMDREVKVNKEYKLNGVDYYSIQRVDNKSDVAKTLLSQGLLLVDSKKDKRLQGMLSEYKMAQDEARKKHLNIWQYGDVRDDDAFEFGMER